MKSTMRSTLRTTTALIVAARPVSMTTRMPSARLPIVRPPQKPSSRT